MEEGDNVIIENASSSSSEQAAGEGVTPSEEVTGNCSYYMKKRGS